MMKRLLIIAIMLLPLAVMAQSKKVALLQTLNGDKSIQVKGIEMNMVRGELRKAISNQSGYQAFTRTDIDQLMREHGFQNSGMVSDAQRKKLGEMSGADYICVSTLTKSESQFYLEAYLIDVETGEISNPASQFGVLQGNTYTNLFQLCVDLAKELITDVGGSSSPSPRSPRGGSIQRGQNFTETAFGINMQMVYVEGGTFTMGCTGDQGGDCEDNESPNRMTTVSSFYMGMFEVTQSQWEKVMGTSIHQQRNKANPAWSLRGTGSDYPMYYVSWEEAKEFCARLSRQTGRNYSLPTEAEWEYAARGGSKNEGTKYSGGRNINDVAWYRDNSNESTHICGTKRPNALGLYDMSGNVWEWCEDWYGKQYLQYDNNNPKGDSTGTRRVLRGGGWSQKTGACRVANRGNNSPTSRYSNDGFRVVLH